MKERTYVAVIERVIRDEVELEFKVQGEMSPIEIERRVEEIASKLNAFDPTMIGTRIASNMKYINLIDETDIGVKGII